MLGELVLYGDGDLAKFLDAHAEFRDIVQVKSRFPEKTVTVVPSGFDHSIPGTTIQFIMMMVIIYGGITVMEDRKKGVLARMLFSPLSKGEVFQAKLLGRWAMGLAPGAHPHRRRPDLLQAEPGDVCLWRSWSSPSSPWPWPR